MSSETAVERHEFMTTGEVAQRLRIHERTVRRAINRGDLAAVELGKGGGYRITEAALQAWLELRRARPIVETA